MKTKATISAKPELLTGEITTTQKRNFLPLNPCLSNGTLPLLYGELMNDIWPKSHGPSTNLGHRALAGTEQRLLTFRFEIDATMIYWFADPHDAEIVAMLRTWAAAKNMGIAFKTNAGLILLIQHYVEIPKPIARICEADWEMHTKRFLRSANAMAASGLLQSKASSDIATIKKLKNVHAFFVLSEKANTELAKRAHTAKHLLVRRGTISRPRHFGKEKQCIRYPFLPHIQKLLATSASAYIRDEV